MIIKKIQKNKKGFVVLFAVVVSSIILAITLGVLNIALKEVTFSNSGTATNDAFFAADTGIECALYWDGAYSQNNAFLNSSSFQGPMTCIDSSSITLTGGGSIDSGTWEFNIVYGDSCAFVTVTKDSTEEEGFQNKIVSKGYNHSSRTTDGKCTLTGNTVERQLEVNY